jgi:hypothetical protein
MRIAAEAWRLREAARRAVLDGASGLAFELVSMAQRKQATPAGDALLRISSWKGPETHRGAIGLTLEREVGM